MGLISVYTHDFPFDELAQKLKKHDNVHDELLLISSSSF
jgi:hypothetical protein